MLIIQTNSLAMTHSSWCKCLYMSFQQNLSKLTYLFHKKKSAFGLCSLSSAWCFSHLCFKGKKVSCFIPLDIDLHLLLPSVRENRCQEDTFVRHYLDALAADTTFNSHQNFQFILFPLSSTVFLNFFSNLALGDFVFKGLEEKLWFGFSTENYSSYILCNTDEIWTRRYPWGCSYQGILSFTVCSSFEN